jgi:sugar-specific transcriptional regulator TrmB
MSANSPEDLFKNYEEKYKEIKSNISELAAVYRMQGLKPKIEVYEGLDGVIKCWSDMLVVKGGISYYQQFLNYHPKLQKWILNTFVPERIRRKIPVRAIVPVEAKEFYQNEASDYRQTKYIPLKKFHFRIGSFIYNDKLNFISCEKGGPLVGIIIQSKAMAETQKALFDLAWEGAEKYQKISKS